jgi:hypothetical protein
MKKIILILLVLVGTLSQAKAQLYVAGNNVNEMSEVVYIELIVDMRLFSRFPFAIVDYGQDMRRIGRQHRVTDVNGNDKNFNGDMDMFNHLYKNGWVHELTFSQGSEGMIYHLFRRRGIDKETLPRFGN